MPKRTYTFKPGQVDTKNIAANIRYQLIVKGWTLARLQLHLWRERIYMYPHTLRMIVKGEYPMTSDLVVKMSKGFGISPKALVGTIIVKAPKTIDDLLMLDDLSMRTFFGGCDDIGLQWIRDSLMSIRNKNAERKLAYMKRAGSDIKQVKRWLMTGQISEEAFVRIYLDKNTTKPKPLSKREKREMLEYRQRRRELYGRDDKILRQRQGRPSLPIPAPRKDPPEYWPSST